MKRTFFIFIFIVIKSYNFLIAQQPLQSVTTKGILYNRETSFTGGLHTNGFTVGVLFGTLKTYYKTQYYGIEIGEQKHPKETRQRLDIQTQRGSISNSFTYGKQNNFIPIRLSYGEKRYFSEKALQKGVSIGLSYQAGAVLGILKPYYLQIRRYKENKAIDASEKYSESNATEFLSRDYIVGGSGFFKGIGEVSFVPGIHTKIGAHFDWGAYDEFVKALELGVMLDVYPKKVPIMINVENRPYFLNLYVALQLGRRE